MPNIFFFNSLPVISLFTSRLKKNEGEDALSVLILLFLP